MFKRVVAYFVNFFDLGRTCKNVAAFSNMQPNTSNTQHIFKSMDTYFVDIM